MPLQAEQHLLNTEQNTTINTLPNNSGESRYSTYIHNINMPTDIANIFYVQTNPSIK